METLVWILQQFTVSERKLSWIIGLENDLLKNKRFSVDGHNIAQSCTTMRIVVTMQYLTAVRPGLLSPPPPPEECLQPILREEVEIAEASLKKCKSTGVDNIPAELVQAGGETMIDVLTEICNRIWSTEEWPTQWITALPQLQDYQPHQSSQQNHAESHLE